MTQKSFDLSRLEEIRAVKREYYANEEIYQSYKAGENLTPEFLSVGDDKHQVRINASTHDQWGILQHSTEDALANTMRLEKKASNYLPEYTWYELHENSDSDTLIVSYGITADSARNAFQTAEKNGQAVSLLIPKTLLPAPKIYSEILSKYKKVIVAEENVNAQFCNLIYGENLPKKIIPIGSLGKMITPEQILNEIL
jgi:2-oxoglutarate/2-oxoacid ferredoxin oxidoreductase subunit alpha